MNEQLCTVCRQPILMMCQKNTGYCCQLHERYATLIYGTNYGLRVDVDDQGLVVRHVSIQADPNIYKG